MLSDDLWNRGVDMKGLQPADAGMLEHALK